MLPPFRLARPATLGECLSMLGEDDVPYCGGTELLLAMRAGLQRPRTLVDLKRVDALRGIRRDGDVLAIGGAEVHEDVARHPLLTTTLPMLARVERAVGNARVRAQGSVGGNLCFAEPKSDLATALMALDASVVLTSARGRRERPVQELIAGPYFADKEPDELLTEIRVPLPRGPVRSTYLKFQTMERPTLGVALVHDMEAGTCQLAVGAVGEVPMLWRVEDPSDIDPAEIAAAVDPVADLTGSERYKRHITEVYVRNALRTLQEGSQDDH